VGVKKQEAQQKDWSESSTRLGASAGYEGMKKVERGPEGVSKWTVLCGAQPTLHHFLVSRR